MAANHFSDFKLKAGGLVENPVALSLSEIETLGVGENIAMHHCIRAGPASRNGTACMKKLIELVKPKRSVTVVAFYPFGETIYGGAYYDTQSLENALKPERLLASAMNGAPLPVEYGARLRLRVESGGDK